MILAGFQYRRGYLKWISKPAESHGPGYDADFYERCLFHLHRINKDLSIKDSGDEEDSADDAIHRMLPDFTRSR